MSHWHFPTTTAVDLHIVLEAATPSGRCNVCGKYFILDCLVKPVTGKYANQLVCLTCISKLNTIGPSETKAFT